MEPVNCAEIMCPQDCTEAIYTILMKRRAHVTHEEPKAGTPFHRLLVEIPVIESFGFETDIRTATLG
jgi:U5 small nuclear ribonucleoprotein component